MLDTLTKEVFEKYLNTTFHIQFQPEVVLEAELIQVRSLQGDSPLERPPFALLFRTAQQGQYYTQATFMLSHPELESIPIFLSPLGPDEKGMTYEAIFS